MYGATHRPTAVRERAPVSARFSSPDYPTKRRHGCDSLQRMQIREQILNVLCTQRLAVAGHFVAAEADDVGDALIIGRQSAQRQIFMLKHSLEARAFLASSGIRLMASVAFRVVDFAACGLLRAEAKFGV